jgi:hypothetical protein
MKRLAVCVATIVVAVISVATSQLAHAGVSSTITVTPHSDLPWEDANLNVSGNGFTPNGLFAVWQCTTDIGHCRALGEGSTNSSGVFQKAVSVDRVFTSESPADGTTIDCLAVSCVVYAEDPSGAPNAQHLITFALASSTTTLSTSRTSSKLEASGRVSPDHAGDSVTVKLFKKRNGSFVKLATKQPTLNDSSRYVAGFARPSAGTCKIVSRFPGDIDHSPSKAAKTLSC